jgi:hypothetical protein
MAEMHEPLGQQEDRAHVRDAALLRISRTRRWMLAGAAALSAGLAVLASALLPGKSFGAGSSRTASSASASNASVTPPLPAPANAGQLGLRPGGQAPESAPTPVAPQPQPQAPAPQPAAPAPAPSGGGAVVSGGS